MLFAHAGQSRACLSNVERGCRHKSISSYAETAVVGGCMRICIKLAAVGFFDCCIFDCRLTEGIPVLANDFSQSCVEGPRILPSM